MTTSAPVARAQRIGLGVVLLLGALDAWRFINYQANPDGVSYIDIALAFAAHGPAALVNGYWSPLLPAVIGAAYKASPPVLETLYPIAHLVGFAVFIVATLLFHRLLLAARHYVRAVSDAPQPVQVAGVSIAWAVYALVILKGIGVQLITPDMGVAGIAFWLAGESLSLGAAAWPARRWVLVGVMLGVGYWWKAILFPVGIVWFAVAAFVAWRRRDGVSRAVAGAAAYAAVALVLVLPVSRQTGRPTFGETGRLNYLWYVGSAPYVWERCRPAGVGDAAAGPFGRVALESLMSERPTTCAISSPNENATLPLWDDPSRYYRDAHPAPFNLGRQLRAVRNNLGYLRDGIGDFAPAVFVVFGIVGLLASVAVAVQWWRARRIDARWRVLLLSKLVAAPVAFYLLVYVEFRHLAPFFAIALVFVPWIAMAAWPRRARLVMAVLALATLADVVTKVSVQTLVGLALARSTIQGRALDRVPTSQRVARALRGSGMAPGARVGSLHSEWNAEWAQLAGLRIRAHVPEMTTPITDVLVSLRDPCVRLAWDNALRSIQVEAVVAVIPAGLPAPPAFERIEDTEYFVHRIGPAAGVAPPACSAKPPTRSSS